MADHNDTLRIEFGQDGFTLVELLVNDEPLIQMPVVDFTEKDHPHALLRVFSIDLNFELVGGNMAGEFTLSTPCQYGGSSIQEGAFLPLLLRGDTPIGVDEYVEQYDFALSVKVSRSGDDFVWSDFAWHQGFAGNPLPDRPYRFSGDVYIATLTGAMRRQIAESNRRRVAGLPGRWWET